MEKALLRSHQGRSKLIYDFHNPLIVEIMIENFYSKKIIVLAFHLDVRTQSFSLLQSYHYLFFNSLRVESDAFFVLHRL